MKSEYQLEAEAPLINPSKPTKTLDGRQVKLSLARDRRFGWLSGILETGDATKPSVTLFWSARGRCIGEKWNSDRCIRNIEVS